MISTPGEEATDDEDGFDIKDTDGLDGITEEFMVCLTRAVKIAQQEEKCCYHCSQPRSFPKGLSFGAIDHRGTKFKPQRGDSAKEGSPDPSRKGDSTRDTPGWDAQGIGCHTHSPFLSPDPFQ